MEQYPPRLTARIFLSLRNIIFAFSCYLVVTGMVQLFHGGSVVPPAFKSKHGGSEPSTSSSPPVGVDHYYQASKSGGVDWRLRPQSLVVANDAFLGPRPHPDTFANMTRLVEECRGTLEGLEKMPYVFDCLEYLATKQSEYYYIPETDRPSKDTDKKYSPPTRTEIGVCNGPIVPYHVYWRGPATWRVELFVKGYLHTQNLPCSRLYIWLDADAFPTAVADMMKDPLFERFLPLVRRGDVTLKEWKIPSRLLLAKSELSHGVDAIPGTTELSLGDDVVLDADGREWLVLSERQMTFLPVAVSDAARFVILHQYGGVYCDMDVLLLRDLRPLLVIPDPNFAERWAVHDHPWDYNTAVMSLQANSSLSSYLLRGGVRMNFNFHPQIIGRLAVKDGVSDQLAMLETGFFDPIWGEFNRGRKGRCGVPCFRDYGMAFLGEKGAVAREWESYDNDPIGQVSGGLSGADAGRNRGVGGKNWSADEKTNAFGKTLKSVSQWGGRRMSRRNSISDNDEGHHDVAAESDSDSVPYDMKVDRYPPNNRTMENFFRGAWSYHIHNQWSKHPQPNSWFDVICKTQDAFLAGLRVNPYGERWDGPSIAPYERWKEFD